MAEWSYHPLTKRLLRQVEEQRETRFKALMNAAASSTDPNVTAAFSRVEQLDVVLERIRNMEPKVQDE